MFFRTLFVLFQLALISQAQFVTYDAEYEEVNLLIRVEDWHNEVDIPHSSFTFEAGEKLFGTNFLWNITAINYDVFGMASIMIHDTREEEYPDRFIQANAKVVSCDGEVDSGLDDMGPITHDFMTGGVFQTSDLDAFVCANDWIRFAVQFRIFKNSSFIFGEDGIISNEVPFDVTRKTLANSSNIDVEFNAGKESWGKSVTWRVANSDFPMTEYDFELVATEFGGGKAFGAGTLEIEVEMTGRPSVTTVYIFSLREYKVGTKIPLKLKNLEKAGEKNYIKRVEFRWETFGLGARFSDYIPYDSTPRSDDPKTLLSHARRMIKK